MLPPWIARTEVLSIFPLWSPSVKAVLSGLPAEEIRRCIREIVDDVDAQAARRLVLNGVAPSGPAAIRKQHPHDRLNQSKKSPAPAVHAASKAIRQQMKEAYRLFVEAYREASARLRAGKLDAAFPLGCFPPAQRFIPADAALPKRSAQPCPPLSWRTASASSCFIPTLQVIRRRRRVIGSS